MDHVADAMIRQGQADYGADRAESAAAAQGRIVTHLSHELRTPMNAVIGFTELLLQSPLDPTQQRQVELIAASGRSMLALLNDLLDLARIEAGEMAVCEEPVCLAALIEECAQMQGAALAAKGLDIELRLGFDLPRAIRSDGMRLRQILNNLIGNAVKFTASGRIVLDAMVSGEEIVLAVEDTGIGIAADRLHAVFEPFTQAERTTASRFGGTGLGLPICRQLTQLLGGRMEVASTLGRGSRFEVILPLRTDDADLSNSPHPAPLPSARVLLAGPSGIDRLLATAMLEACGQEVTLAEDGHEALAVIVSAQSAGHPFDLALFDLALTRMDAMATAAALRQRGIDPQTLPIIGLGESDIEPADAMQDIILRPMRLEDLTRRLRLWLDRDCAGPAGQTPPTDLAALWQMRRGQALEAVARLVRSGAAEGCDLDDLARQAHKLAGSAGSFGETTLGNLAGELSHALRRGEQPAVLEDIARQVLAAA